MAEREPISPRTRFEVLKRDNFTCRYCGRHAPDVELEVDHVIPVAKGGTNEFFNLVTACWECNIGKSDKLLSDKQEAREHAKNLIEENAQLDKALEDTLGWEDLFSSVLEKRLEFEKTLNEQVNAIWMLCESMPNINRQLSKWPESRQREFENECKKTIEKEIRKDGFNEVLARYVGEE